MNLILASASPRRQELLKLFGIPFTVRVADIDETMTPGASAYAEVARVSHLKALAVPRDPEDVVVAADTIVVCQEKILGKPRSKEEAVEMLTLLSGGMTVKAETSLSCPLSADDGGVAVTDLLSDLSAQSKYESDQYRQFFCN